MDYCALLLVFLSHIAMVSASTCLGYHVGPDVEIPHLDTLLSLDDFDAYVVNHTLGEFYYIMPNPAPYEPYINYFITFMKEGEGLYMENTFGETPGNNARCVRGNSSFHAQVRVKKASFYDDNTHLYTSFWSTCPTSYILMFRCKSVFGNFKRCPVTHTNIAVLIPGSPTDIPMAAMVQDICRVTGIKFGAESFRWFFTYGETKLC